MTLEHNYVGNRLFVFDVHGLAVPQFMRLQDSQRDDSDGQPCEMIDAMREWLLELLGRFEPQYAAACFEGRNNWRKDAARGGSSDYKSNRPPKDERLVSQLDRLPDLFDSLGIACVRHEDNEADDIMATLAALHASESLLVTVVTGDKDISQVLTDNVEIFSPPRAGKDAAIYDAAAWEAKTQIPPHRMCEYLALVGDTSDNVAGVKGWGKVAATNAITQTRSWAELERKARGGLLERIKPALQASLIEQLPAFAEAHRLVTLRCDVDLTETLEDLCYVHPSERAA